MPTIDLPIILPNKQRSRTGRSADADRHIEECVDGSVHGSGGIHRVSQHIPDLLRDGFEFWIVDCGH
jgi:hypothetical protein